MSIRSLVFVLTLLSPGFALAYTTVGKSGEHSGFTRLVFSIPQGATWSKKKEERSLEISISPAPNGADLTELFTRIARDRVSAVRLTDAHSILIDLNCDCIEDDFLWNKNYLVLDFHDGAIATNIPQRPEQQIQFDPPTSYLPTSPAISVKDEVYLNQLEQELVKSIQASITSNLTTTSETAESPKKADAVLSTAPIELPGFSTTLPFTSAHSDLLSISSTGCLSDKDVKPWLWSDGRPIHLQLSDLYASSSRLNGNLDDKSLVALAKLYTAYGFESEARQVVSLISDKHPEKKVLSGIWVALTDYTDKTGTGSKLPFCEDTIWTIAVTSRRDLLSDKLAKDITNTFLRLPNPMSTLLRDKLSKRFVDSNLEKYAIILQQAPRSNSSEPNGSTISALSPLVAATLETKVRDVKRSLELANMNKVWIGSVGLTAIDSLAFESGMDRTSDELRLLILKNYLIANRYSESRELLDSRGFEANRFKDTFFRYLALYADDSDFINYGAPAQEYSLEVETMKLISDRFSQFGLDFSSSTNAGRDSVSSASTVPRNPNEEDRPDPKRLGALGLATDDLVESEVVRQEIEGILSTP